MTKPKNSILQESLEMVAVGEINKIVGELYTFAESYRRGNKLPDECKEAFTEMAEHLWKA